MRWRSVRRTGRRGAYSIEASERWHWYFRDGRGTISDGLTSHPADDGFHEIQLNGKQLVFLFMAATVVSVVIFLCGVLVGRGVRADRGSTIAEGPIADPIATGGTSPETAPVIPPVAPPASYDPLSAIERLEDTATRLDELKSQAPKQTAEPTPAALPGSRPAPVAVSMPPPPAPAAKPAQPAVAKTTLPAAASGTKAGYVVQLAALNSRSEADAMAKRLSAKGYEAYVQAPAENAPAIFRVRVGAYPTRSEAESAAARLEKEGKFKPWVAAR